MSSTEFDPISEIKTLRQNLTQRLQMLQSSDVPKTEDSDLHDTDTEAFTSPLLLAQQISHARQQLSQLQIDQSPKSLPKKNSTKHDIDWEKITSFLPSLNVLKTVNIVLTWIGFFGIIAGILFSRRYTEHDSHLALPIIVAGIVIIAIGAIHHAILQCDRVTN